MAVELFLILPWLLAPASPTADAARTEQSDLFSRIDLEAPGLSEVRIAVRRRDSRRAERALLDYFRRPEARRRVATANEGRANLALLPISTEASVRVVEGGPSTSQADLIQGWYSREYGVREAAPVAVYRQDATPPILFEAVLYPYAAGRRPAFGAERMAVTIGGAPVPTHQVSAFEFRYGLATDRILMTHDPDQAASSKQAGDLRTDAEVLVLRLDTAGRPTRLLARGVSSVTLGERILFSADRRQDSVDRSFSE